MHKIESRLAPSGLSAAAVFRAGWRPALALLVLLLAAASPITSAAQDSGFTQVQMDLTASPWPSLNNLCAGDRVTIDVTANRFLSNRQGIATGHVTNAGRHSRCGRDDRMSP